MSAIKKTDHFYLVDGSGYIFRAYYALPPLSRKSDGLPTGAVSGFSNMLFKLLEESRSDNSENKPTHFAVIFDSARKNFRNEIYKDYKANRSETPDDLIPQFDLIKMDVQGSELDIIKGGKNIIMKSSALILEMQISEYNKGAPMMNEIIAYLKKKNFILRELIDFLYKDGELIQVDGFFTKQKF